MRQIIVDEVTVKHHASVKPGEPGKLQECRAGKVEDTREQGHAREFGQNEDGTAEQPVPRRDGVQAEQFGRNERQAGQQECEQRPAR